MKMISILLTLIFSITAFAQRTQIFDADYVRIRDGVAVNKFELGYINGLTSNAQTQLNAKEGAIAAGTSLQYWRGDKTWQTLNTTAVPEGTSLYFTNPRVRAADLSGLSTATSGAITSSDTVLGAFGKLQNSVTANTTSISGNTTSITTNDGLAVHKAGTETITGDKLITGQLTTTSTTKGNRPCPVMTDTQMLAIASPSNGDCVMNSTKKAPYYYDSVAVTWKIMGGGAGAGTRLELETDGSFEDGVTEGTCSGCVASQETGVVLVTPNNTKSLKMAFTASTGSYTVSKTTNGQFTGADMTVGAWVITDQSGCSFKSRINGADTGEFKAILGDSYWHYYEIIVTGGSTSNGWKIDCTTSITGSVYVDETSTKASPRVATFAYVQNASALTAYTPSIGNLGSGSASTNSALWRRVGEKMEVDFYLVMGASAGTGSFPVTVSLPSGYTIDTAKMASAGGGTYNSLGRYQNATSGALGTVVYGSNTVTFYLVTGPALASGFTANSVHMAHFEVPVVGWSATNPNYLTAPETFSTDYTPLTFKTSAVASTDSVGTFSTHNYGVSSNTRLVCSTPPTQSISSMAADGFQLTARGAFTSPTSCTSPSSISIRVGNRLKGDKVSAYFGTGKTLPIAIQKTFSGTTEYGAFVMYDEVNGILHLDVGLMVNGAGGNYGGVGTDFLNNATRSSGYFVINASKNPALTGLNVGSVAVSAVQTSGQSIPNATNTTVVWDAAKVYDTNNAFNSSTGTFTSPINGYYQVNCKILFDGLSWGANTYRNLYVNKNGAPLKFLDYRVTEAAINSNLGLQGSATVYLAAGDTLSVGINHSRGSATTIYSGNSQQSFIDITKVGF